MLDRHEWLLVFARFQEHVHHALDAGIGPGGAASAEAQLPWPVKHQVLSADAELHAVILDSDLDPSGDAGLRFDVPAPRWPGAHPVREGAGVEPFVVYGVWACWQQAPHDRDPASDVTHRHSSFAPACWPVHPPGVTRTLSAREYKLWGGEKQHGGGEESTQ